MSMTQEEFNRRAAIEQIAKTHKLSDIWKRRHIEEGSTLAAARAAALDQIGAFSGSGVIALGRLPSDLQLTQRERSQYSITRAILAQCQSHPEMQRAAENSSFEAECSAEIAKRADIIPRGLFVPFDVLMDTRDGGPPSLFRDDMQHRVLTASGGVASGGALVQNTVMASQYITPNYNIPVAVRAGARVLSGLTGNVLIPKMTAGKSGTWVNPENTAVAAADPTFTQIQLNPKDIGAVCDMSRRLLIQSTPAIDGILRDDIVMALMNGIDQAAINGSGSGGQPLGLMGTAGVTTISGGTNGAVLTWSNVTYLQQKVAEGNRIVTGPAMGFVTTPQCLMHATRTPKVANYPVFIAQYDDNKNIRTMNTGGGVMAGELVHVSNNVPSNLVKGSSGAVCSALIYGCWSDLLIGEWGMLDLLADPYTFSNTGAVRVRAFMSVDIAVRYPQSWAMLTDVITT